VAGGGNVLLSLSGSTLSLPNSFTLCAGSTSSALSNLRHLGLSPRWEVIPDAFARWDMARLRLRV
jgi:hypothetical protein